MDNLYTSAFTVDVEDGISIAMRDAFGVTSPQTDRVVRLTSKILALLADNETKATFFVLGQVADKFPELIKQIASEGHELGVHGYNHLQFFRMTPDQAYQELDSAKKLIEDISATEVLGHRAPAFSITPETQWALDVVARVGFVYDSSIMPAKVIRYGWPGFPKDIHEISTEAGNQLIEVPLSTLSVLGKKIPVCGGGYLRLFPYSFTKKAFEKVAAQRPVIIYLHPYELDTLQYPDYYFEQLEKSSLSKRMKMKSMWINRKSVYGKLEKILSKHTFGRLSDIITNNINYNLHRHEEFKKIQRDGKH
jgi:polysaccharide deacetylase family protein (PEP-CTERM system associated)